MTLIMLLSELESNEREATNLYGDFLVYIISCNIPKISRTVHKMSILNSAKQSYQQKTQGKCNLIQIQTCESYLSYWTGVWQFVALSQ